MCDEHAFFLNHLVLCLQSVQKTMYLMYYYKIFGYFYYEYIIKFCLFLMTNE